MSPEPAKEQTDVGFERLLDAVLARIDREELIHLTQELVRIPSVHRPEEPDGNEARTARFLADYLEQAGFEVQTEEVAPGRPNVWAVWEGDRPGRTLLFEAHTDVVTEGREGLEPRAVRGREDGIVSSGAGRATPRGTWRRQ